MTYKHLTYKDILPRHGCLIQEFAFSSFLLKTFLSSHHSCPPHPHPAPSVLSSVWGAPLPCQCCRLWVSRRAVLTGSLLPSRWDLGHSRFLLLAFRSPFLPVSSHYRRQLESLPPPDHSGDSCVIPCFHLDHQSPLLTAQGSL